MDTEEDIAKREKMRAAAAETMAARELAQSEKERKEAVAAKADGVKALIKKGAVGITDAELSTLLAAADMV